jgi:flagella basal body P-ring formation protein FlgA
MRSIAILVIFAALADAACVAVSSGKILAGDLAAAVPLFEGIDPGTPLGFAPLPGTQRVLSSRELTLIARRHGLEIGLAQPIPDMCVQRLVQPYSRENVKNALIQSLGVLAAELELIEFSSQPLPPGQLEFRLSGLSKPPESAPESPVIWRGRLIYDGHNSVAIWARVCITVQSSWFVATENISAGAAIRAEQVRTVNGRVFPYPAAASSSTEEIAGKVARRAILAGQRIIPNAIAEPADVAKGEKVRVKVLDGLAALSLDAIAQSSGKKGDIILVHNPSSGRNFRAVIEDKATVVVRPAPGN